MGWMQLGRVRGPPSSVTGSLPPLAGILAAVMGLHACVAPCRLPQCTNKLRHGLPVDLMSFLRSVQTTH